MAAVQPLETGDPERSVVWAGPVTPWEEAVEIVPGIWWVRAHLPFALDHVNLLVLDDGDGWTAIDAGHGDPGTYAMWRRLLDGPFADKPLRRLLVTHFHPDHLGAAGWLCRETGAVLMMTPTEWLCGRMLQLDESPEYFDSNAAYDHQAGLDPAQIAERRSRGNRYRRSVSPVPLAFQPIEAGQELQLGGSLWRVILGSGHAPAQVTLHSAERGILLAADQVLPRITPVVGIWPAQIDQDPLGSFQRSLALYETLPAETLVLPGHERPFRGLPTRIRDLRAHHDARLDEALALVEGEPSLLQVMRRLFTRPLDPHQLGFGLAETLAHLRALQHAGLIVSDLDQAGVERFRRLP